MPANLHMALVAGDRVGPYEVLDALGAGGMSTPFQERAARFSPDGRWVA